MTRDDLDLHGCRLADLWHEATTATMRAQVLAFSTELGGGDRAIACYLGARVFDRLRYMGAPMDAQEWLDALERRAEGRSRGDRTG